MILPVKFLIIIYTNTIRHIVNAVYGPGVVSVTSINTATGSVYPLANVGDPVLVGPFGDARGAYRGNDGNGSTYGVTDQPSTEVALWLGTNPSGPTSSGAAALTGFRSTKVNLVFFGDGGFVRSENPTNETDSPLIIAPPPNCRSPKPTEAAAPRSILPPTRSSSPTPWLGWR